MTNTVKKSVSVPNDLWKWAEKHSKFRGHEMVSRTVTEALLHLQKKMRRKELAK